MRKIKAKASNFIATFFSIILLMSRVMAFPATAVASTQPESATDRYVVRYHQGHEQAGKPTAQSKKLSYSAESYSLALESGESLESAIAKRKWVPGVASVIPDYKRHTMAISTTPPSNWGIPRIGADKLAKAIQAKGTAIVAVVDTGIYADHPLLRGKVLTGYNFVNDSVDTSDNDGHGTHVAGIIAQEFGTLPVQILPVKVLGSDGSGYDSDIAGGILYAVNHGAHVINLSLGGQGKSVLLEEAIQTAVRKGVVVVAAAGNDGTDDANLEPASIPECLTVSAINKLGKRASFSSYGATVDVAAPGQAIISSVPLFADKDGLSDGYISYSGTSMAAPYVSGIAALLRVNDPRLTGKQIEALLKLNVEDAGVVGWDKYYGYGIINFAQKSVPMTLTSLQTTPDIAVTLDEQFKGYREFLPSQAWVTLDHAFQVTLSQAMALNGLNAANVKILDYTGGQKVDSLITQTGTQTFKIRSINLLLPNSKYWLVISPPVVSASGKSLSQGVIAKFFTAP